MNYKNKHALLLLIISIYAIEISYLPKKYFMNISRIMSFFTKFTVQQAGLLGRPGNSGEVAGPHC